MAYNSCQILSDFQNSCIDEKRRKFPKQKLEKISPHLIYVATLPSETLKSKITGMNYVNRMILTQMNVYCHTDEW